MNAVAAPVRACKVPPLKLKVAVAPAFTFTIWVAAIVPPLRLTVPVEAAFWPKVRPGMFATALPEIV